MLEPGGAGKGARLAPRGPGRSTGRRRAGSITACAALAVMLHLALLDGFGGAASAPAGGAPAPISVRAIAAARSPVEVAVEASPAPTAEAETEEEAEHPAAQPRPRTAREPVPPLFIEASAGSAKSVVPAEVLSSAPVTESVASAPIDRGSAASAAGAAAVAAVQPIPDAGAESAGGGVATMAGIAGPPPPLYRTVLPPAATLHYQVRRGAVRGEGEIRWQRAGDAYRLVLEARVAGLTLLLQTSDGSVDGNGLVPLRFLDQRARRAAQAANFVRDSGRITFSGTTAEWPLVAGSQDRLSWMIQLAGIVAADPALIVDDARITMAVVGARGDAGIWSLRSVGEESVETATGTVRAVKLVREARLASDTTAEIWLDPARSYLPVRATLRNGSGAPEYDLQLDRIGP